MQAHVLDQYGYVAFIAVGVVASPHHHNTACLGGATHFWSEDRFLQALVEYEAQGFEIILEEVDYWPRG